jgi:hypothetical protein
VDPKSIINIFQMWRACQLPNTIMHKYISVSDIYSAMFTQVALRQVLTTLSLFGADAQQKGVMVDDIQVILLKLMESNVNINNITGNRRIHTA